MENEEKIKCLTILVAFLLRKPGGMYTEADILIVKEAAKKLNITL